MRILFQGDSITDVERSKDENNDYLGMGRGYAALIKSYLNFEEPKKYEFFNRGINGNRTVDLYARIKADIINLKPDVMSILIGINDVGYDFRDKPDGVDAEKYYRIYSMLIDEVKEALPDVKIMIMEPFTLKGRANEQFYEEYRKEVIKHAEKAKLVAKDHGLVFIPLQKKFDEAAKLADNRYWLEDGVHPNEAGHELIKREWLKFFKEICV